MLREMWKTDKPTFWLLMIHFVGIILLIWFAAWASQTISESEEVGLVIHVSNYNAKQEVCLKIGEIVKVIEIDYELYSQIKAGDKIKVKKTVKKLNTFYEIVISTLRVPIRSF